MYRALKGIPMFTMTVKKDSLTLLPVAIQRYIREYFVSGVVFGAEVYHAFLDRDFPVTKNLVRGRAPIHSDAADNLFSEGLHGIKLMEWILSQQEKPHDGVVLLKM
jgi:hypothetical protein